MNRIFIILLLIQAEFGFSQVHLQEYISFALRSNQSIRQQEFLLQKNLYALDEAKSLFLPTIAFNGSYTLADGGRSIDFPVGDLLNPVYSSLNQLTATNAYPQLQNQQIQLNPNNFYDAHIRTTFPIVNAELQYNRKIKATQYQLQQAEIDLYKRELVKEIKVAYFRYLQAGQSVGIYQSACLLFKENLRINNALFTNQKINRTAVIRSENELSRYNALLVTARQAENNARAYFNFLLNTDLHKSIIEDSIYALPAVTFLADSSVARREELTKIQYAATVNKYVIALAKSYRQPKLNSFLDLGSQAFDGKVNRGSWYYLGGLTLEWNIFSGNKNKYRVRQAAQDALVLGAQKSYTEKHLQLQVKLAMNALVAANENYRAASTEVLAAQKYADDVARLYREGQVLFIELLDAQNELIRARLQQNVSLFDAWIKTAEIERANAAYPLLQMLN